MSLAYRHFDESTEDQPLLHPEPPPPSPDESLAGPSDLHPAFGDPPDDSAPPPYRDALKLEPTTPMMSLRYDKPPLNEVPAHVPIQPGLFAAVPPAIPPPPEGWVEFIHPEGQKYFYSPARRIVTESNLRDPATLHLIVRAAGQVDSLLAASQLPLPNSSELMLELEQIIDHDEPSCKYYFVDHVKRAVFWLEHTNTGILQLPPVTSVSHLKYLMVQHYWNHVEFFPMHIALPASVEEELIAILSHAAIDGMTSDLSTVPYNPEQCDAFIKRISAIPESQRVDGYRNCIMARIYSELTGNFFVNLYGEPNARLSRNQRLLPEPIVTTPAFLKFVIKIGFNSSLPYHRQLDDLWVDKISYMSHWRVFMKGILKEWRQMAQWGSVLMITSLGLFAVSTQLEGSSNFLSSLVQMTSLLSVLSCILCTFSAALLLRNHTNLAEAHAHDTVEFLDKRNHQSYGLQPLAIMFAFPWTSLIWAITFFFLSVLLFSFTISFLPVQIFIWCLISFAACISWFLFMFMNNGAAILSREAVAAIFELPDNSITRMVIKRPFAILRSTSRGVGRRLDATVSVLFKWLRRFRHGGRNSRAELREP